MDIQHWPFDEQKCNLSFGSWTYGENQILLEDFKPRKQLSGITFLSYYFESIYFKVVQIEP